MMIQYNFKDNGIHRPRSHRKGQPTGGNVADRSLVVMDPGWVPRFGSLSCALCSNCFKKAWNHWFGDFQMVKPLSRWYFSVLQPAFCGLFTSSFDLVRDCFPTSRRISENNRYGF